MTGKLTLKQAIKTGNLEAFIAQQEAEGIEVPTDKLAAALERAIKQPPEANQTSPAPSRGGSGGK